MKMILPTMMSILILGGVVISLYVMIYFYKREFKELEELEKKLY